MDKDNNLISIIDNIKHRTFFNEEILNKKRNKKNCLFLDRDGVIIEDCHYLSNPKDVKIIEGIKDIILHAKKFNWLIVIVTNQSGINRNFFTWNDYESVNRRMIDMLNIESPFDAIYANGYGPNHAKRTWRKPNPDMLFAAKNDLDIDLSKSILIGDRLSDLKAGTCAQLKLVVHVKNGHGRIERAEVLRQVKQNFTEDNQIPKNYFCMAEKSVEIMIADKVSNIPLEILEI